MWLTVHRPLWLKIWLSRSKRRQHRGRGLTILRRRGRRSSKAIIIRNIRGTLGWTYHLRRRADGKLRTVYWRQGRRLNLLQPSILRFGSIRWPRSRLTQRRACQLLNYAPEIILVYIVDLRLRLRPSTPRTPNVSIAEIRLVYRTLLYILPHLIHPQTVFFVHVARNSKPGTKIEAKRQEGKEKLQRDSRLLRLNLNLLLLFPQILSGEVIMPFALLAAFTFCLRSSKLHSLLIPLLLTSRGVSHSTGPLCLRCDTPRPSAFCRPGFDVAAPFLWPAAGQLGTKFPDQLRT
nr:hypothetical protein Iba_chr15eCG1220 [Ipomoea batatas]